ncbi:Rrf2 family transcriptional regulator [Paenibacillus harenae]|uniref:Rrf2 family transcriptional regulator n=1 Tax=Paenibacillus harenae TaxID=306543 RepID=UPI0027931059|nr:Rrf2 family transcriptional regulator [Paenibacillus harenae]MDQ0058665.1 Rrf2 family protein [Paenibacillus harenae]
MQFAKSTGYALHALLHLARSERGRNVGIKELASMLDVSESYLSKIMSKLRQDGLLRAVTGASGGYELARPADQITFLDVVHVIEGRRHMFECLNENAHTHEPGHEASSHPFGQDCLIMRVMNGAEREMHRYLQRHTIQSVLDAAGMAQR